MCAAVLTLVCWELDLRTLPSTLSKFHQIVILLAVGTSLLLATQSECEAQLFRRHRRVHNGPSLHRPIVSTPAAVTSNQSANQSVNRIAPGPAKWEDVLGYDPRIHLDADRNSRYPKFIGGFHSSHFTDVGLPTGDKGFRGNGLYWTPW